MKKTIVIILFISISAFQGMAEINPEKNEFKPSITPYLNVQFWNTFSSNYTENGIESANRFVSYFRRGRVGVKGFLLPEIKYNAQLYYDYLGKDSYISAKGTPNSGTIGVWSVNFTWKISKNNEGFNLTGGTFLPQISREAVAAPWSVTSLDKAETSTYLRQFISGKTNGICPGLNLGGLVGISKKSTFEYNFAIVNRQDKTSIMQENWSPVILGRVSFVFGDKENQSYKFGISPKVGEKAKKVILGLGASHQGETDIFTQNSALGADVCLQYNLFKIESSFYFLKRENTSDYNATCLTVKSSADFLLKNKWFFQPTFMYDYFQGDDTYADVSFFDGNDKLIDLGLNTLNPNQKIKIGFHYIIHAGEGNKNHFISAEKTMGNYACLSIQFKI